MIQQTTKQSSRKVLHPAVRGTLSELQGLLNGCEDFLKSSALAQKAFCWSGLCLLPSPQLPHVVLTASLQSPAVLTCESPEHPCSGLTHTLASPPTPEDRPVKCLLSSTDLSLTALVTCSDNRHVSEIL